MIKKLKKDTKEPTTIDLVSYDKIGLDIDIEATGDKQKGEKNYPYEIGVNVYDYRTMKPIKRFSLIINEIFKDEIKMDSAFFKNKIPFYNQMLDIFNDDKESNCYKCVNIIEAIEILNFCIKKFKIEVLGAFNVNYDYEGVNYLYALRPNKRNNFKKLGKIDIRLMFLQMLVDFPRTRKKFIEFCKKNNKTTEKGFCSTTAETCYCFFFNDINFKEKHTGLEDLKIETKIKKKIIQKYKKNKKPFLYELDTHKIGIGLYSGKKPLLAIE